MYDLIVIGGGPAGYLAAERAAKAGLNVLLFEERALGGVCLNEGCIPSKTLLYSAKLYDYAKHDGSKYGVTTMDAKLDHAFVIKRKDKVVHSLVSFVEASFKKLGITLVREKAIITGKNDEGFTVLAAGKTYDAKRLLLATGSQPIIPPISGVKEGLEKGFVLTNREVFHLTDLPKELVVIGGGVIGLEMASYFNSAGCHVTVIEMLDTIGGGLDKEIAYLLRDNYEKKGIAFHTSCRVTAVEGNGVVYLKDNETKTISADRVLLSIGRRATTEGIGLATVHVYTLNGAVVTDDKMQTNVSGIYAAGDINGKSMLAHTAYREAEVAVNNILNKTDRMSYNAVPGIIYTNPEVACVGETGESARLKGYDAKTVKLPMQYSGRYVAENENGNGICKVVYDQKNNRVLGVQLVCNTASEIISSAAMIIDTQLPLERIRKLIFPHPSVSEIIREAIFEL